MTKAFLSYCMADRKTTVHRSEHLRVDKFVSLIPMLVKLYLTSNNSLNTFPVCKKEWKSNAPPVCIKFYIQPPLSLVAIFSYAPPLIFQSPPLQVIIAQSLRTFTCHSLHQGFGLHGWVIRVVVFKSFNLLLKCHDVLFQSASESWQCFSDVISQLLKN